MIKSFGILPSGHEASLFTISGGGITATATDYGATLVSLLVPDASGVPADVILGYDDANGYRLGSCFFGAPVGRNANRTKGSCFSIGDREYHMTPNENGNNLHSGPDCIHQRFWKVKEHKTNAITFALFSPSGDQGFPGNAEIEMCYRLDENGGLHISYDAVSDQDTVFNFTNHSYFNLAGHEKTDKAMDQILCIPGRFFNPCDAQNIPTGELRPVEGTPMDFRTPKPIGRDITQDYEPLKFQGGYDHNFEVFCNPCATLTDSESGRSMAVYTDRPGIQFYAGNFIIGEHGKGGIVYDRRSAIALETQFYPDSLNHPEWPQPIVKAGEKYHSETVYRFCW